MTNPVNVIITVMMAKDMKIINGSVIVRNPADMPNAKYGCRARRFAIESITT